MSRHARRWLPLFLSVFGWLLSPTQLLTQLFAQASEGAAAADRGPPSLAYAFATFATIFVLLLICYPSRKQ